MNTMCELLDQYMFARTSTTGNGQTDIINNCLFICMQYMFQCAHL